jgi:hypothetical protein
MVVGAPRGYLIHQLRPWFLSITDGKATEPSLQVPSACDLGRVVPQLAYLRNFAGCVELPLKKAELLDPSNLAVIPGPEGRAGRVVPPSSPPPPLLPLPIYFSRICHRVSLYPGRRGEWVS